MVAADRSRFFDFLEQLFAWQDVAFVTLGAAVKRAKVAHRGADIGVVDVPVDVVGPIGLGVHPPRDLVGRRTDRRQITAFE